MPKDIKNLSRKRIANGFNFAKGFRKSQTLKISSS